MYAADGPSKLLKITFPKFNEDSYMICTKTLPEQDLHAYYSKESQYFELTEVGKSFFKENAITEQQIQDMVCKYSVFLWYQEDPTNPCFDPHSEDDSRKVFDSKLKYTGLMIYSSADNIEGFGDKFFDEWNSFQMVFHREHRVDLADAPTFFRIMCTLMFPMLDCVRGSCVDRGAGRGSRGKRRTCPYYPIIPFGKKGKRCMRITCNISRKA